MEFHSDPLPNPRQMESRQRVLDLADWVVPGHGPKTLQMKKDCLGEDSTEYATSLNNLGNLFFADKDYDEALKTCARALEIKAELDKRKETA